MSPKRPCIVCGVLSPYARCDQHGKGWRDKASKTGMPHGWAKTRAQVLREEPRCRLCGSVATDVDHILNRKSGGTEDRANLRALCSPCHKRKSSREGAKAAQANARRRKHAGIPSDTTSFSKPSAIPSDSQVSTPTVMMA